MKEKKAKKKLKRRRHRLIVLSFRKMTILLILGFVFSMYQGSFLSRAVQPDGFALTATDLIGQLTVADVHDQMTQIAEQRGTDFPVATQTPDDFALTATQVIGQMTENAKFVIMTQEALGIETNTPDPTLVAQATEIMVTIDAVIRESTQDAMFLTDVAEGVSTFTSFDKVVEERIVKVEAQLGFTHPELALIVEKLLAQYQSDLQTLNIVKLSALAQSVIYKEIDYVTVMLNITSHTSYGSELLVFARNREGVELLF